MGNRERRLVESIFSGRWGTNHGNEVHAALKEVAGRYAPEHNKNITTLISTLQTKLAGRKINPDGDLHKILSVIKEKTGVDFYAHYSPSPKKGS